MKIIIELVCYALVFYGAFSPARGAVYSTEDTSVRFSQCVIENVISSRYFTAEDRDDMVTVADVMAETMRNTRPGPRRQQTLKILMIGYITSMATIILDDSRSNIVRKRIYVRALEQCSVWTIGYVDADFINEAIRIMSRLEIQRVRVRAPPVKAEIPPDFRPSLTRIPHNPEIPGGFDTLPVQPSPVQNPFNPELSSADDRTVFEIQDSSFDFTSSSSEPNSQLSVPNERNVDSSDSDRTLSSRGGSEDVIVSPSLSSGEMTPPLFENPQSPAIFEGLSIPQTKESMVFVIPPKDLPQSEENTPDQEELVPQAENVPVEFPRGKINSKNNSGVMNPSESLSETDPFNVSSSSALESIISDILTNSSSFSNAFNLAMNQEDAQQLARTITLQSLSGYNSELTEEAMTAVSNAVAKVSVSSPENYAFALSEALALVLKRHNITLFYDEASISSDILTNLDTKQDFNQQISSTGEITDDLTMVENPSSFEQQPPLNFHSPGLTPEDETGESFSNTLSQYLAGSFMLAQIFCASNNTTNNIQTYFRLIKSAMSMYGTHISLIAAITICGNLMEVPTESLCSGYPRVISDMISEILYENGQLQEASPEEILKQMELSANFLQASTTQTQQPETDNSEKDTSSEFDKIIPTLQSSYSYEPGTPLDIPTSDSPSSDVDEISILSLSSDDHSLTQQEHEKYITETNQDSVRLFSDSIPISPVDEQNQHSESSNNYTILTTTPFSIQISEEALSEAILIDTVTTLSHLSPTDKSLSDDSIINEDELATYLLGEMESALAALNDKQSDQEPTANTSESVTEITKDKLDDHEPTANHSESISKISIDDQESSAYHNESVSKTTLDDQEPIANHSESVSRTAIDDEESTANHGESVSKTVIDNQEPSANHSESVSETTIDDQEPTANHSESVSRTAIDDQESAANHGERVYKTSIDDQEPTMIHTENVGKTANLFTDKQTEIVESETKLKATTRPRKNYQNRRGHKKHKATTSEVDSESNSTILNFSDHDVNKTDIPDQLTGLNSDHQTEKLSGSVKKDLSSSPDSKSATISNIQRVDLQPSFQGSQFYEISSSSEILPTTIYDVELNDRLLSVAKSLSEMSSLTIAFIRSENFDINELCAKLNEFASILDIPPLNSCKKVPVIDFLMHVLLSTVNLLKGVQK